MDARIQPHLEQQEAAARRERQTRLFHRNQVFGLLLVVAAIVVFTLFRTHRDWIFPAGWWRP